jgi:hypothetical protein
MVIGGNALMVADTVAVLLHEVDVLVTVTVYMPLFAACALGTVALALVEFVMVAGPVHE